MKLRGTKDLSIAAVGKYGTLQEFSFFDKVTVGAQMGSDIQGRSSWEGSRREGEPLGSLRGGAGTNFHSGREYGLLVSRRQQNSGPKPGLRTHVCCSSAV